VGLLGFDFIAATLLHIDYEHETLDAFAPGALPPPAGAVGVPIRLNRQQPSVSVSIDGFKSDDFLIDTGAGVPFMIFQRFFRPRPNDDRKGARDAVRSGGATSTVRIVGGRSGADAVTVSHFSLGDWNFATANGFLASDRNIFGIDNEDGLIGADILRLFDVYLDYPDERIYLEPNARFPR